MLLFTFFFSSFYFFIQFLLFISFVSLLPSFLPFSLLFIPLFSSFNFSLTYPFLFFFFLIKCSLPCPHLCTTASLPSLLFFHDFLITPLLRTPLTRTLISDSPVTFIDLIAIGDEVSPYFPLSTAASTSPPSSLLHYIWNINTYHRDYYTIFEMLIHVIVTTTLYLSC